MATAAAAIVAKARREVENLFFDNDAFSPERAVDFVPRIPLQQSYLEQMIGEGIVHEAKPGRYWLDLDAYRELRRQRFIWTLWIVGLGCLVAIIIAIIRYIS